MAQSVSENSCETCRFFAEFTAKQKKLVPDKDGTCNEGCPERIVGRSVGKASNMYGNYPTVLKSDISCGYWKINSE